MTSLTAEELRRVFTVPADHRHPMPGVRPLRPAEVLAAELVFRR